MTEKFVFFSENFPPKLISTDWTIDLEKTTKFIMKTSKFYGFPKIPAPGTPRVPMVTSVGHPTQT